MGHPKREVRKMAKRKRGMRAPKHDPLGSYTGTAADGRPVQDADDL